MRWAVVVAALSFLSLFVPSRADACSAPPCIDEARLTGQDAGVPANAPAVVVWPQGAFNFVPDAGVSLVRADGTAVPHTVESDRFGWMIRPEGGFEEGVHYLVHHGPTCEHGLGGPVPPGTVYELPFVAAPPAALPTAVGTLSFVETEQVDFGPSNSCGGPAGPNVLASFAIELDEAWAPWLPVTEWNLDVDDNPWARLSYGLLGMNGEIGWDSSQFLPRSLKQVFAACPVAPDAGSFIGGRDPGLKQGRHVAKLRAQVAGSTTPIEAAELEFLLVCDGGTVPLDGPGPLSGVDDVEAAGCGCQSGAAGGALFGLVGFALLLWRAHRNRNRLRKRRKVNSVQPKQNKNQP